MPATPRDLLKPRAQRLEEIFGSIQLQASQANSQQIVYGCTVSPGSVHTYDFDVAAGEVVMGQGVVEIAAALTNALPAGAGTSAGQFCNVLIEVDSSGAVYSTAGALAGSAGAAVTPALTAARIAIAVIAIPASFTVNTTAITTGMITPVAYSAGNESPTSGF